MGPSGNPNFLILKYFAISSLDFNTSFADGAAAMVVAVVAAAVACVVV